MTSECVDQELSTYICAFIPTYVHMYVFLISKLRFNNFLGNQEVANNIRPQHSNIYYLKKDFYTVILLLVFINEK